MIPPKRFDIFPPDWGMLRRSRRLLIFLLNTHVSGTRFSMLDWVRVTGLSCTKGVWYIYDWDTRSSILPSGRPRLSSLLLDVNYSVCILYVSTRSWSQPFYIFPRQPHCRRVNSDHAPEFNHDIGIVT